MKPQSFIVHLTRNDLLQLHSYANCRLLGRWGSWRSGPAGALMLRLFGSGSMKSNSSPDRHEGICSLRFCAAVRVRASRRVIVVIIIHTQACTILQVSRWSSFIMAFARVPYGPALKPCKRIFEALFNCVFGHSHIVFALEMSAQVRLTSPG